MVFRYAILSAILIVALFVLACGDAGSNTTVNVNSSNSNTAKTNSNNPIEAKTPAPEQTTNNAPTLTPVFKAYCQAMEKKNEAGIRSVYSKDTLAEFEKDMKEEGSKSLVEYLSIDQVTTALCDIRNEVITGDTAVAEVKTAGMPNGAKIVFVKEGNEWKITNRSPSLDAVKQTATNSGSAK
jgi:hypothetical protein